MDDWTTTMFKHFVVYKKYYTQVLLCCCCYFLMDLCDFFSQTCFEAAWLEQGQYHDWSNPLYIQWEIINDFKLLNSLQWHHNERHCISSHQHPDCLLSGLFRHRSKKTSKFHVSSFCEGNPPVDSPHKGPVTWKMFPFDDVIMYCLSSIIYL